jgi:hypothetical protein
MLPYEWIGPGVPREPDGATSYYEAIRLRVASSQEFLVRRGDAVLLRANNDEAWICRIESISGPTNLGSEEPRFCGRWFHQIPELERLMQKCK